MDAATVQGELAADDPWRAAYARSNPRDTDEGAHPQNIFRLLTRAPQPGQGQQVYTRIGRIHTSDSPNRNESNGVFLLARYQESGDCYYAGIRVDGAAVIKKKFNARYHILASTPLFGHDPYDRHRRPNQLPLGQWVGLRLEAFTSADGTVTVELAVDRNQTGEWATVLRTIDDGGTFGGPAISRPGRGGIRTDFMDVEFDEYTVR